MQPFWWKVVTFLPPIRGMVLPKKLTTNMLAACMVIWMLWMSSGFNNIAFTTIQAMDAFGKRFGSWDPVDEIYTLTPLQLALFNSLDDCTDILISAGILYSSDRLGRRFFVVAITTLYLAGFGVCYTAQTYAQILIGRLFYTSASCLMQTMMQVAMAEILPGALRGNMIALNAVVYQCSTIMSAGVSTAASRLDDDRAWRYMLYPGVSSAALAALGMWLVPESPRWLLRKGRKADATKVLRYIYGARDNFDAEQEMELIHESLREAEESGGGRWKDLLQEANKRRIMILIGSYFFERFCGSALSVGYTTIFFRQVGGINPFLATMIRRIAGLVDPFVSMYIIDRVPRRKYRMVALALLAAVFSTMGGLGCAPVATRPVRAGIISMAMLAVFLRGVGLLVPNRVMMGEIPHPQLRDQTTMVALTASQIFDFTTSFTFPYLLNPPYANLRSRVGFVFAPFCALGVVFVYFCVPDLSRRSLEEIEEIFRMKVPAKKTRHWKSPNGQTAGSRITALENGSLEDSSSKTGVEVVEVAAEKTSTGEASAPNNTPRSPERPGQ